MVAEAAVAAMVAEAAVTAAVTQEEYLLAAVAAAVVAAVMVCLRKAQGCKPSLVVFIVVVLTISQPMMQHLWPFRRRLPTF